MQILKNSPSMRKMSRPVITSTANGKVKRLVNLVKKRKVRDQEGVFVTEGPDV